MNRNIILYVLLGVLVAAIAGGRLYYAFYPEDFEISLYEGNYPIGTFKAMIGDEVAFTNGPDIIDVDPNLDLAIVEELCLFDENANNYFCPFRLSVVISSEAAQRHADITLELDIIERDGFEYLSENLTFYLNDELIDALLISSELKGTPIRNIQIMGSGVGDTKDDAIVNTEERINELFDVLGDFPE